MAPRPPSDRFRRFQRLGAPVCSWGLACLPLLSAPGAAQETWTSFRNNGVAVEAELGEIDPARMRWRIELSGTGHGSPVVWKDKVFVTSEGPQTGSARIRRVVCLDANDGETRWSFEEPYTPFDTHKLNRPGSCTPALANDRCVVSWIDKEERSVQALDFEGKTLWKRSIGPFVAKHGAGGSPVIVEDVVLIANEHEGASSSIVGLDLETGEVRWKHARRSLHASFASPLVYEHRGRRRALFASSAHGLTALDPGTGKIAWAREGLFDKRCVATPALVDGVLFVTAGQGGGGTSCAALLLEERDAQGVPKNAYGKGRSLPYVPSPVGHGEWLFLWNDGGIVSCRVATTGKVLWRERLEGSFFGSPIRIGDHMLALSLEGDLFVLAADDEFELVTRWPVGESQSTPAFANGTLYLRTLRHLLALPTGA